ncbi:MAG: hypothetical protein HY688_04965 [Chloroflexi bacterium]|nr:hypothetical protein [Chloroflexota bacterium]
MGTPSWTVRSVAPRSLILGLLGLGMAALYVVNFTLPFDLRDSYAKPLLDLGKMTGYQVKWAYRFTGGLLALFTLYGLAWMAARGRLDGWGRLAIAGFGVLFQALLLPCYPVGAADVFDYLSHARVLVIYGGNPLVDPPSAFPGDPYLGYAAWPFLQATYGPLWAWAGAPAAYLSRWGGLLPALLYYKVLAALLVLAGGVLLHQAQRRLGAPHPWAGTLLLLWNPLVAFEFAGNAHNDALLIFLLLLSLVLLVVGAAEASFLALSAASLTKFVTAPLFAPLIVAVSLGQGPARKRLMALATGLVLAAALGVLLYLPFWHGRETLSFLQRTSLFTTSPAALLARALEGAWGWEAASRWAGRASLTAFAIGTVVVTARLVRGSVSSSLLAVYEVLFVVLVLGLTWFKPWYVAWLLAVAPLTLDGRREARAAIFSLSALLSYTVLVYIWPINGAHLSAFQVEAMVTGTVFLPVLLFTAAAHWPWRRGRPFTLAPQSSGKGKAVAG